MSRVPETVLQTRVPAEIAPAPRATGIDALRKYLPKNLSEGLFGTGLNLGEGRADTGLTGFLYSGLTKTDQQKYDQYVGDLVEAGTSQERAGELAYLQITGQDIPNATPEEQRVLFKRSFFDLGEKALDALDFIPAGGILGLTGDVVKKALPRLLKETTVEGTEKILRETLKLPESDVRSLAPSIAKSSDRQIVENLIQGAVRTEGRQAAADPKLVRVAQTTRTPEEFVDRLGITPDAAEATVRNQGYRNVDEFFSANSKAPLAPAEEIESLERLAARVDDTLDVGPVDDVLSKERLDDIEAELAAIRRIQEDPDGVREALDRERLSREFAREDIESDPARQLSRFARKRGQEKGTLPEVTGERGRGRFREEGDEISEDLGFESSEVAREAYQKYLLDKRRVESMDDSIRTHTSEYRDRQAILEALRKEINAKGKSRLRRVRAVQGFFNLTNEELAAVMKQIGAGDLRLLTDKEFTTFMDALQKKAVDNAELARARLQVRATIFGKELVNTEALRELMKLPPVDEMNLEQLARYEQILSTFKTGDEFLTKRTLEVIDRTALKGARTFRQVREFLAQQIKRTIGRDVDPGELDELTASSFDKFRYDTALAEKDPWYGFVVNRTQTHMMEGETSYLRIKERVNRLAKDAGDSRARLARTPEFKRRIKEKLTTARAELKKTTDPETRARLESTIRYLRAQTGLRRVVRSYLAPTHPDIIRYLEARGEDKLLYARTLTAEELKYAEFLRGYYNNAYNYLLYINEISGARYVDAYFTHTRKAFLEKWADDGLIEAFRGFWSSHKEDQMIANIVDDDTGTILPKSKFFQYTLRRTGEGEMSQNVTRVFLQYARMLERKRMLDKMVPEIDVYTQSLTPRRQTQRGLEMDRSMRKFINEYLNNKRGRKFNYGGLIRQNGAADMAMRLANSFVSLVDLGFNLGASTAAIVGEQFATYQALGKINYTKAWKRRIWDTGVARLVTKGGKNILKESEAFIGENVWTQLADVDQQIGDKLWTGTFGLFGQSTVEANKIFLLGSITKEELRAGKLSAERLAQLRLEAGRWRDMGKQVKSIIGSTSVGETGTKYRGWAIPIARTTGTNLKQLGSLLKQGDLKGAFTSREFAETYRMIEMTAVLLAVGSYVVAAEDDDSFVGQLRNRAYREALTLLQGVDPRLYLASPRLASFLIQLGNNLTKIALLEEYKTDSKYGNKGDLKGVGGLKQQFTPSLIRQFLPSKKGGTGSTSSSGGAFPDLPELPSLPSLPSL